MKVQKTIKLFINGEFVRSESGRVVPVKQYANLPLASRKDFRVAVDAARTGQKSWGRKTAFNRSQILYRMAEMCETKRAEFTEVFSETLGSTPQQSQQALDAAIDAFVYYAGFCDKFQQMLGAVNPVNGPHHNFTTAEPVGVVALLCSDRFDFSKLIADIASILVAGNSVIVLLSSECPAVLGPLGEVFATSDLPAGAVNLLTGDLSELLEPISSHMEVDAILMDQEESAVAKVISQNAAENMKRVVNTSQMGRELSLDRVLGFVEYKTVWHPIGV